MVSLVPHRVRNVDHRRPMRWRSFVHSFLLLVMLVGLMLTGPGSQHRPMPTAAVQPALLQVAAQQPEAKVRIIVQKYSEDLHVEQLVQSLGGEIIADLSIIRAFAAQLPASAIQELAASPAVRWVSLDAPVISSAKGGGGGVGRSTDPTDAPPNTYLETTRQSALVKSKPSLTGQGIGVAVVDSGIATGRDFSNLIKIDSFNPQSTNSTDVYGHGTHVAGIIGGNGTESNGLYKGIAPGVKLISLKISDDQGLAYESDTVAALQWIYNNRTLHNIRVVNLSINSTVEGSYHTSPLDAAAEILWFNGIVVVTSSGNKGSGINNTANAAPANDPFFITVGASDEKGTASLSDDIVAAYSAFGTTKDGFVKPEIVAPGSNIYSVLSNQSTWVSLYPERTAYYKNYFRLSGTSMAAPMVTGAVALLLQDEPNLTPDQVKYRLLNSGPKISKANTDYAYLDIYSAVTGTTTQSANTGLVASQLLWSGSNPVAWNSVNWNSVNWNSVNWNSVNWNSVNWNSVNWNSAVLENATAKRGGVDDENADEPTWEVPAWPSPEDLENSTPETPSEPWQPQHHVFVPMVTR